jgi:hypothetical protein
MHFKISPDCKACCSTESWFYLHTLTEWRVGFHMPGNFTFTSFIFVYLSNNL